jgi:hypothetical protein
MASNFTDQVYKKASDIFDNHKFEANWDTFLKSSVKPRSLLASDGPNTVHAEGLDKLRAKLANAVKESGTDGKAPATMAKVIIDGAKGGTPNDTWVSRAAAMKMLKHLYRHSKSGAQDVWIYSPPKDYAAWIFDELKGSEADVLDKLAKEDEVYSSGDKDVMCDALKIALACSQKTEVLLGTAEADTMTVVKRWFGDAGSETANKATVATLLAGFKKITAVCNANTLVFPDDPNDRKSATKYDKLYGSVWPGGEGSFYVIYLAGAFKKSGNSGKLWLCAQTILHEASHLVVSTKDHRYDTAGLKPGSTVFSNANAIENADSWGYFSIDLCGYLSKADRDRVLV